MFRWILVGCWTLTMTVAAAIARPADARVYYVATDGREANNGSRESPWPSVAFALSRTGGGQTILVRPGVYRGPIEIGKEYAGTREQPTVIKSEVKWKAVIIGAPYHGISNSAGCHWIVIDGFEVLGARYDGVKLNGDHNVVRNCWVHNNGHMGIAAHGRDATVIEDNLIEFNGSHVQFHHGVYVSGEGLTIRRNVIRHNAAYGLHLYPSIKNSIIASNLVYGHVRKAGVIVSCPSGGGHNRIVNNTIVGNGGALRIVRGDGEIVMNNILISKQEVIEFLENTRNVQADYNLCTPPAPLQGPHGVTGDARFVEPSRAVFWLRADSPAIQKGAIRYAPATDFWRRPYPRTPAPDLGAFPFVRSLCGDQARAAWYENWPYRFAPEEKCDMPDLWLLPTPGRGQ